MNNKIIRNICVLGREEVYQASTRIWSFFIRLPDVSLSFDFYPDDSITLYGEDRTITL